MCRRAVAASRDGRFETDDGATVEVQVDTICLHGDHGPSHVAVQRLRRMLEAAGIAVAPLGTFARAR